MIKIKHYNKLIESDIPVPKDLVEFILNAIKSHVINYLLADIDRRIKEINHNKITHKDFLEPIDLVNYEKELKILPIWQKELKFEFPRNNRIWLNDKLENTEINFEVSKFFKNQKYNITDDRLKMLRLVLSFKNNDEFGDGSFTSKTNTIEITPRCFERFLRKVKCSIHDFDQYGFIFWQYIFKYKIDFIKEFRNLIFDYQSTLTHELVHFIQYNFMSKVKWAVDYSKVIDDEEAFKKYISSDIEFYPKLKGAYVDYMNEYHFKYDKNNFEKFINNDSFFKNLKTANLDKYKKAIKQFYMMLQIKNEGIMKNNHNLMDNILIETIVNSTSDKIKERIVNPHNVKDWNMEQVKIMQDLIKMNKFNLSDTNLIIRFGKMFHDFVISHKFNAPTTDDMIKILGL